MFLFRVNDLIADGIFQDLPFPLSFTSFTTQPFSMTWPSRDVRRIVTRADDGALTCLCVAAGSVDSLRPSACTCELDDEVLTSCGPGGDTDTGGVGDAGPAR